MSTQKCSKHHLQCLVGKLSWLLPVFNCKFLFPVEFLRVSAPAYIDASTAGGGCCWQNDWLYVNWAIDFLDMYPLHINYKETFMILQAVNLSRLDMEVCKFWKQAYATSTKDTYKSQLRAYFTFCVYYGYHPLPASTITLSHYAAFLARSLSAFLIPA